MWLLFLCLEKGTKTQVVFSNVLPMNTTIEVICYNYKPQRNNKFPLKLRITQNRKRRYIGIGVFINSEHWDFTKNRPKPNKKYQMKFY